MPIWPAQGIGSEFAFPFPGTNIQSSKYPLYATSWSSVLEVISSFPTRLILAKASPLNPKLATFDKSWYFEILLVVNLSHKIG